MTDRAEILAEGWLDGSLSDTDLAELEALLADPAGRQRLADWLQWRSRLHRAYDDAGATAVLHGHQVRRSAEADGPRLLDHLHRHRAFARRRSSWRWVGLALAAALLGMVAWWSLDDPAPVQIETSGLVLVDGAPLTDPSQLHDPATISVPAASRLDLQLADHSAIQLQGPASCRFTGLAGPAWSGVLDAGLLRCRVGRQSSRRSLFTTDFTDLRIEGTDFQLVAEDRFTGIELYEGALVIGDRSGTEHRLEASHTALFDEAGLAGTAELLAGDGLVGRWDFNNAARLIPNRVRGRSHQVAAVPPACRWVDPGGLHIPPGDFLKIAIDDPACIAALHEATAAMEWQVRILPDTEAPLFLGAGAIRIDDQGARRTIIGLSEAVLALADADGDLRVRVIGGGDHWRYQIGTFTATVPHQPSDPLPTDKHLASRWYIGLPNLPAPDNENSPFVIESLTVYLRPPASWD